MEEYFSLADGDDYERLSDYMQNRDNIEKNNIDQLRNMTSFRNPMNIEQSHTLSSFSNFGGLFGNSVGVWGDGIPDKDSISGMSTGANTSIANVSVGNTSIGSTASYMGSTSTGSVGSNQWVRPTAPRPPPGFESYNNSNQQLGQISNVYHNESGTMLGSGVVPPGLSQSLPPTPGLAAGLELGLSSGYGQGLGTNRSMVQPPPPPSSYSSSLLSPSTIASTLSSTYDHVPLPLSSHSQSHGIPLDIHRGENHDNNSHNLINNNIQINQHLNTNHSSNHNIMEELLRLEIDHQQLQQEKMHQRQQQQQ